MRLCFQEGMKVSRISRFVVRVGFGSRLVFTIVYGHFIYKIEPQYKILIVYIVFYFSLSMSFDPWQVFVVANLWHMVRHVRFFYCELKGPVTLNALGLEFLVYLVLLQ